MRIRLSPEQITFLSDPHKIKVLIAGRQWGKSHALMAGLAKVCASGPGRSAVVMPLQSQATDFYKLMMRGDNFESLLLPGKLGYKLWPFPQMNFKSGHYLEFRSFENPNALRGGKWDGVVVTDEANNLDGDEISRVLLPKVSVTDAQIWVTSTITHHNWLWDFYLRGQGKDKVVKSWLYTTAQGLMFQGERGKERLGDLRSVTAQHIWDSEYCCIPGSDNSMVFPFFEKCIIDLEPQELPQRGRNYLIGLDLGRVDQTVAVVGNDEGLIVDYMDFPTGSAALEHAVMARKIDNLSQKWRNARVVIDSTGKGGVTGRRAQEEDSHVEIYKEVLEDRLEEFYWSPNRDNATKFDVISNLALMTEQKKIRCPRKFSNLITQMRMYRIQKARGSHSTFGPKEGSNVNDDAVAALAQFAWGMKQDWFGSDDEGRSALGGMFG